MVTMPRYRAEARLSRAGRWLTGMSDTEIYRVSPSATSSRLARRLAEHLPFGAHRRIVIALAETISQVAPVDWCVPISWHAVTSSVPWRRVLSRKTAMNRWIEHFDKLQSPLVVACCLPELRVERLEAALAPMLLDLRSRARMELAREVRRAPPDLIVIDPTQLALGTSPSAGQAALRELSAIGPPILWLTPSAVRELHHDPLAYHAEWLIDGVDDDMDSIRSAIARTCSQVPARIVIALEPGLRRLPRDVAMQVRGALGGGTPDERLRACDALESMKASSLRGQLARASIARLREIRRVARLWSAYERIRLGDSVHLASSEAGYGSERSLLNDSVALLGCSSRGLARVTCGQFLTAAVTTLDRSSDDDRKESLSA